MILEDDDLPTKTPTPSPQKQNQPNRITSPGLDVVRTQPSPKSKVGLIDVFRESVDTGKRGQKKNISN